MGLQINPPVDTEGPDGTVETSGGDEWGTRIAKLIPAEALGLYGSAVAMVPDKAETRQLALWIIVGVACALLLLIRTRSARDPENGELQTTAVAISLVSFFIWLAAIGGPTSPIAWPEGLEFAGPLLAFLWGTLVPYLYDGRSRARPKP